uniref:Uncharacterized protein n=1 Tax=Arundo donax TaxID=35708 RepID=A0A0A9H5R7_ARUDO
MPQMLHMFTDIGHFNPHITKIQSSFMI